MRSDDGDSTVRFFPNGVYARTYDDGRSEIGMAFRESDVTDEVKEQCQPIEYMRPLDDGTFRLRTGKPSKVTSDAYRVGWDSIFGKQEAGEA